MNQTFQYFLYTPKPVYEMRVIQIFFENPSK